MKNLQDKMTRHNIRSNWYWRLRNEANLENIPAENAIRYALEQGEIRRQKWELKVSLRRGK